MGRRPAIGRALAECRALLGGVGATLNRTIRAAWAATGTRFRVLAVVSLVLVGYSGGIALWILDTSDDVRSQVIRLGEQTGSFSSSGLLEPGFYLMLSDDLAQAEEALLLLDSRLRWIKPFEFIPLLGGRISAARNTVALGREVATASSETLHIYGSALAQFQSGGEEGLYRALSDAQPRLAEVRSSLIAAGELVDKPLVISDAEVALLRLGIAALQTLTIIAADDPGAVEVAFELVSAFSSLRSFVNDPFQALIEADQLAAAVGDLDSHVADLLIALQANREANPDIGGLEQIEALFAVASDLADAGVALLGVVDAAELGLFSPAFGKEAGVHLSLASEAFERVDRRFIEFVSSVIEGNEKDFETGFAEDVLQLLAAPRRALDTASAQVALIRSVLGFDDPKRYLVVMQNQDEIRATGGFIGAVIEFPLRDGVLGVVKFDDSTMVDIPPLVNNPLAPEPLYWYLWSSRLLFRDANWSPHFPASAKTLIDLYTRKHPVAIDGVISATKVFALDLVDVLGTVSVPGIPDPVDRVIANQYIDGQLSYPCEDRHISLKDKRCFDEDLISELLDGMRARLDDQQRDLLVLAVKHHLERKDIMLFVFDDRLQQLVKKHRWGGDVPRSSQDFLMVVDSALPGHSAATTKRTIEYTVRLNPLGDSEAMLNVSYRNFATRGPAFACRQADAGGGGCFWNYFRIFLPRSAHTVVSPAVGLHEGSEKLIWGYRDLDSGRLLTHADEGLVDLVEVGGYLGIEPGKIETVPVVYKLGSGVMKPAGPNRYEYRLTVARQSGLARDKVRIRIALPDGATNVVRSPIDATLAEGFVDWAIDSPSDAEIVVIFTLPDRVAAI